MISSLFSILSWVLILVSTALFLYDPSYQPHPYISYFLFFVIAGVFHQVLLFLKKDGVWVGILSGKKPGALIVVIILSGITWYLTHGQLLPWWGISLFFIVLFWWLDERIFFGLALSTLFLVVHSLLLEKKDLSEYFSLLTYYFLIGGVMASFLTSPVQKYIVRYFPDISPPDWWYGYISELRFFVSILHTFLPLFFVLVLLFSFLDWWVKVSFDSDFLTSLSILLALSRFFREYQMSRRWEYMVTALFFILSSLLIFLLISGNQLVHMFSWFLFLVMSFLVVFCRDWVKKFAHRFFSL